MTGRDEDGPDGGPAERIGVGLFRASLILLPRGLRERAADEMVQIFRARHRRARGPAATLRAWSRELAGVVATAVSSRLRCPGAPRSDDPDPDRRSPVDALLQDLRFALRSLSRRPAYAVLAILTLALGIAASTSMFTVVDRVLLRPLPYPEPENLVALYPTNPDMASTPSLAAAAVRGTFAHPEYEELARRADDVLEAVALTLGWSGGILDRGDGPPERIPLGRTTPGLFSEVLRVDPLVGRTFTVEDEGTSVLLLTEGLWRRRFGADPDVVGSSVPLSGVPHTVVGVLREGSNPSPRYDVDAWALFAGDENPGNHSYFALARLRDGVSPEQARAALSTTLRAVDEASADFHNHGGVNVFQLHRERIRNLEGPLMLLAVAAFVLLLVACGNVAALMVGAALDRERELAVRGALGAGRGHLIRQLLTESLVVAGAAGAVGLLLTTGITDGLVFLAPDDVPRIDDVGVDPRALGVALALAVGSGVAFGLIPALSFSSVDLRSALTSGTRHTGGRARIQAAVVVGELALATVLLVGAGLLGRTVLALDGADPGFDPERLMAVRLSLPRGHLVDDVEDPEERFEIRNQYYERIAAAVETLPGVEGVARTTSIPLEGFRGNNTVHPEGYQGPEIVSERRFVTADFFRVAGIRIVEGRGFRPADDRTDAGEEGVAVVSEGLAARAWPGESAVGKTLSYWDDRVVRVVGVAENVRDLDLAQPTETTFYAPLRQAGQSSAGFVVRTAGDPEDLVPAVRNRIWDVDAAVAIPTAQPLTRFVRAQTASERYRARLVGVFSVLAALFSLMGVYGVTTRNVTARIREMGIRKALGAEDTRVLGMVLKQALRLAVWGAGVGLVLAFVATRFLESYLWGVEPTDLATLTGTALLLGAASVAAALAPGRRAARVDPMEALRVE